VSASLGSSANIHDVLGCLEKVRKAGENQWDACCPAHEDVHPSLRVSLGENGKILLHCFAGCSFQEILREIPVLQNGHAKQANGRLPTNKPVPATQVQIGELAGSLGVSREALSDLMLHHDGRVPCFPERDAKGSVTTWNRRLPNGKKLAGKGEKRGLIYPDDIVKRPNPVLVAEGPSDAAALLTMGLTAVGRPSAGVGAKLLAKLLAGREVIVVGDNDKEGVAGAKKIAGQLATSDLLSSGWACPPCGSKDVRAFLNEYKGDPHDAGDELLAHLRSNLSAADTASRTPDSERALTDVAAAEMVVAEHGRDLRYCKALGWLVWNGRYWERDDTEEVYRRVKKTIRGLYAKAGGIDDTAKRRRLLDFAMACERSNKLDGIMKIARSESGIPIRVGELDRDPWKLNVENGTIDLRTGKLNSHDPTNLITKLAPVEFDPSAECPVWTAFLDRIFGGDPSMIAFVRRAVGSALVGVIREHVLHVLHGSGANGKSTLIECILGMMGDYAGSAAPALLLSSRNDRHPTERADLLGKRFVATVETGADRRLNEELVKQLTGGDRIKGRFMHKDFFEFAPTHKLLLATNHKPEIRGTDHAIWRRVYLWPFSVIIPDDEQDGKLKEKLREEWPGILLWCVEGCLEWQQHGLSAPQPVLAASAEYRIESDVIAQFLEECCTLDPDLEAPGGKLYTLYAAWCKANGHRAMNNRRFSVSLLEHPGIRRDELSKAYRIYRGVEIRGAVDVSEGA